MSSPETAVAVAPLAWAEQAHALVETDPQAAQVLAERALGVARARRDVAAEVAARYALGWALCTLGSAQAGRRSLQAGIRLAESHADRQRAGLLRRHLAYQLGAAGRVPAARRELDTALTL